jgi:acetyl-CoA acetyltransferase family protein
MKIPVLHRSRPEREVMMNDVVIVDAVRTPVGRGKAGGALSEVHPVDLLAQVLTALVERSTLDPGTVDDVMIGCVSQVGEQSATPGRMAWLGAGFPEHVPATTIDRKCGSSQQAVTFAAQAIRAGDADIVIAGGIESMSRVPMGSAQLDKNASGLGVRRRYAPDLIPQGVAADLVAARWGIDRDAVDRYSVRSHQRAGAAAARGDFDREIVAARTPDGLVSADETIRPGSTVERLAALPTAFDSPAWRARFPELAWTVTAGNASQLSDGASALLLMSEQSCERLGLTPRARVVSSTAVGSDPLLMLSGPIPATHKILERSGMTLEQMDQIEINEAFASVPLAWLAEFDYDQSRLNTRGGAIALGHPLGASGARIMTTMLHALEDTGGRYGLQLICEAGGMANATILERL